MAKVPIKQAQFNKAMFRALKAVRARAPSRGQSEVLPLGALFMRSMV